MARGVNLVIILGNLGRDPDVNAGVTAANFSIATSEKWRDKQTGEQVEKTEWHKIVAFGKLAEIVEKYLKKGAKVYIEGKLQTRKWQDKEGNDRYTTEIVVNNLQMLDGKNASDNQACDDEDNFTIPGTFEKTEKWADKTTGETKAVYTKKTSLTEDFDDDVPF